MKCCSKERVVPGLGLLLALCGCVALQPPESSLPPPPKVLYEEELKPVERPEITIQDIDEQISDDHKTATVTGNLINRGNGATHTVILKVTALDNDDNEIDSHEALPSTQTIPPGGRAAFVSIFARRPEIDHYHVEAISR